MALEITGHVRGFFFLSCLSLTKTPAPHYHKKNFLLFLKQVFCVINPVWFRSLIKLHILSLGSILTTKYRLKYLCVSIWQREQRRYLYWNCIALDRFLPPPAGIDRAWGDQEWLQLQPALAAVWECIPLPGNNVDFSFVFLIWKMCIWRGVETAGGRSELTCKDKWLLEDIHPMGKWEACCLWIPLHAAENSKCIRV